ncbi:MAG: hypothetical protein WC485_00165 [Opitutaceae bacterium]
MSTIIDDSNWQQVIESAEAVGGFFPGALPRESEIGGLEGVPVFAERIELLPESRWPDVVRDTLARGGFIGQRLGLQSRSDYQNGFPTCWAKSAAQAVMGARFNAGLPFVQLQGESLIGVTGGRIQGYYLDKALTWMLKYGIASSEYVPQHEYNRNRWKPGYEQDALQYMPLEGFDGGARDIWAETITALVDGHGCYAAYNWARHAVWLDGLVLDGNRIGVHTPNTHGPGNDWTLFGSKAIPSELYVIRATTYNLNVV